MLDLATLKATLQPIRKIGEIEEYFKIDEVEVCMRVLTPKEELEIQRWSNTVLASATEDQRENDNSLAVEYLNRFKLGCLSHALVEINGMDLRNEEYIATGEVLSNGKAVKIKKFEALVQLLESWPRPLLSSVFKKFNEIMERCEIQSDKSVEFNPPDIDSEISNLMQRIQTLEEMKSRKDDIAVVEDSLNVDGDADADEVAVTPEKVAAVPRDKGPRQSAIPNQAAPLEEVAPQAEPEPNPEPVQETIQSASGTTATAAAAGGWIDPKDDDSMESAIAAETRRMEEMRSRRHVPPHVQTQAANEAVREKQSEVQSEESSENPRFTPPNKR